MLQETVIERIATALDARRNCIAATLCDPKSPLLEWIARHAESAEKLTKRHLPSGSGFDMGTTLDLNASRPDKIVFHTSFHHMDNVGYYDGWTEHTVTVRPSFVHKLHIKVSGRDRNDIKDHITDAFVHCLTLSCSEPTNVD